MSIVLAQQEDVKISTQEPRKVKAIKAEIYSRVVGYYRPVQDWNRGKKEEFSLREELSAKDVEATMQQPWPEPQPGLAVCPKV